MIGSTLPPPIHPFPARMAPDLALDFCRSLPRGATVFDPMAGSGTTLRAAIDSGHNAIGMDMDPLAVLMARVWTTPVGMPLVQERVKYVLDSARKLLQAGCSVPWIDDHEETEEFTRRWFAGDQRAALRAFASVLSTKHGASWDVCRIALSRIIITKDRGASLARDVSHSRPHKVAEHSTYDVFEGFERSAAQVIAKLSNHPPARRASLKLGDARVPALRRASVDAVITSPPYLNAIDYLRGHRLSLVWLGYSIAELRSIRSDEIGSERGPNIGDDVDDAVLSAMGNVQALENRLQGVARRYVVDCVSIMKTIATTLRPGGTALLVVGNSSLRGVFLENDRVIDSAATLAGLECESRSERELPPNRRYLPPPAGGAGNLNQRMRTEVLMRFRKPI